MVLSFIDGTQNSTAAEVNLFDITGDLNFATYIFVQNMVAGDKLEIKVYVKDENGATMRVYDTFTLKDVQADEAKFIPFLPTKQYKVSIKRLTGTDRAYTWQRIEA